MAKNISDAGLFQLPFGVHRSVDLVCEDESLTLQSCKDECDINNILDRWQTTGVLEHSREGSGFFGDFSDVHDYQFALALVSDAKDMFDNLPSSVRDFFANDPSRLLAFVNDESNHDKAVELGLIEKLPLQAPQETETNNDA